MENLYNYRILFYTQHDCRVDNTHQKRYLTEFLFLEAERTLGFQRKVLRAYGDDVPVLITLRKRVSTVNDNADEKGETDLSDRLHCGRPDASVNKDNAI